MIGMLLETEYPKDIRVRKEAESLVANGIDVVVIVPWKKGESRTEEVNGVRVERIGGNNTFFKRGWRDIVSAIFFINWMFYFKLPGLIRKYGIDHLHVHDLPLAKTAYLRRSKISGKVVLDAHENYPDLLESYFMTRKSLPVRLKNSLLFKPSRWKKYERKMLPKMDYIIAVIEEMRDRFIAQYNIDQSKIIVVSNYEKKAFAEIAKKQVVDSEFTFEKDVFYVVYVGGISPMRGLNTVVEGVKELIEQGKKVKFLIIGGGSPKVIEDLLGYADNYGVKDDVLYLGYKPFETVNYYMQNAGLNVIPHLKTNHTDYTIPHKLFQIFLSKAPILVSSCLPLKRIVMEKNAGWVFEASDANSFVAEVKKVMVSPANEITEKTERGYQLAMTKYNWENAADVLTGFYRNLN